MNWKKEDCIVLNKDTFITKYISKKSNVSVYLIPKDNNITKTYFTIATEAVDDTGWPHVLEHLIFLGSENYNKKGYLDKLANRNLANGTNAWTAVDHTTYTIDTVDFQGLERMMPIYLDHILKPSLHDDAFLTEVHFVNNEGRDFGVVYTEMANHEHQCEEMMERELMRLLFSDSAYSSNTGGSLEGIRSLTNSVVKQQHRKFYRWSNLSIIVFGRFDEQKILEIIENMEEIDQKTNNFWETTPKKLDFNKKSEIFFPSDDETSGNFTLGYFGLYFGNVKENLIIQILLSYLCDTNISPLYLNIIEKHELGSGLFGRHENYKNTIYYIEVDDVPVEDLNKIADLVFEILNEVNIDLIRIRNIIDFCKLDFLEELEVNPCSNLVSIINENIVGAKGDSENLKKLLKKNEIYEELSKKDSDFWQNKLKTYFIDEKHVCVLAFPDPNLREKLNETDEKRRLQNLEEIGEKNLDNNSERIKNFMENQKFTLSTQDIPKYSVINFPIEIKNDENFVTYLKMKSDFIEIKLNFQIDLPIFNLLLSELIFQTNIEYIENNKLVNLDYENVTKLLEKYCLTFSASVGNKGSKFQAGEFSDCIFVNLKLSKDFFDEGIRLLLGAIFGMKISKDRLKKVSKKLKKNSSELKRDANYLLKLINLKSRNRENSSELLIGVYNQIKFLKNLEEIPNFRIIHKNLIIKGEEVQNNKIKQYLEFYKTTLNPISKLNSYNIKESILSENTCYFSSEIDCGYLLMSIPGPNSLLHEDYLALMLICEYMSAFEGPLYAAIRQTGFSYGFNLSPDYLTGTVNLYIYPASELTQALQNSLEIVKKHLEISAFNEDSFQEAKSLLIHDLVKTQQSLHATAQLQYVFLLRNLDLIINNQYIEKIKNLELKVCVPRAAKYLQNFNSRSHKTTISVVGPKKNNYKKYFEENGINCNYVLDIQTFFETV